MTQDPQGRLIISPHAGKLLRMTVAGGKLTKVERLDLPCTDAMGLLYASNSLFLDCNGPQGVGLYRASDLGETFGPPKLLRRLNFWMYEHGAHTVALGPDGKLYLVAGDATELPADLSPASPFHNCAADQLLPSENDPHALMAQCQPVGGFVLRMDVDGTHCEWFAGGARNNYAVAFNPEGELIGADNDPNWELGLAWYRPCRITHWVSGGDYGYRQGTGELPSYDQDTLPTTRDIGLGAPSGVKFAPPNCAFPPAYRDAFLVEDWTYGRLLAVHLVPRGATYEATVETVLQGMPLTMTSLEFGQDGSLYFITGGRESESGLYRLSYEGPPIPARPKTNQERTNEEAAKAARGLRRQLESYHGRRDPRALEIVWPNLSNPDRWVRYAARVALEFQDAASWRDHALAETNVEGGLTALLALARCGGRETQAGLFEALEKFPFSRLTLEQQLFKLRVMEVSFIRQGRPPEALALRTMETLDALYPSTEENLNEELCQLLLYLQAPDAVAKTVALLDNAATQEDQTCYLMRLRTITNGWTLDLRKDYLGWLDERRRAQGAGRLLSQTARSRSRPGRRQICQAMAHGGAGAGPGHDPVASVQGQGPGHFHQGWVRFVPSLRRPRRLRRAGPDGHRQPLDPARHIGIHPGTVQSPAGAVSKHRIDNERRRRSHRARGPGGQATAFFHDRPDPAHHGGTAPGGGPLSPPLQDFADARGHGQLAPRG